MTSQVSEFDAMRLTRDAQSAGEAFGFEDVEGDMPQSQQGFAAMWWIAGAAIVAAGIGYGLL